MKYQVNYIESFTGGREIKAIVEADSEEEAQDLIYEGQIEDWEIVDENMFLEGIDIQSIEELDDLGVIETLNREITDVYD